MTAPYASRLTPYHSSVTTEFLVSPIKQQKDSGIGPFSAIFSADDKNLPGEAGTAECGAGAEDGRAGSALALCRQLAGPLFLRVAITAPQRRPRVRQAVGCANWRKAFSSNYIDFVEKRGASATVEQKCLTRHLDVPPGTTPRLRHERSIRCTCCSFWGLASWEQELRHSDLQPDRLQPSGLERVPWSLQDCYPSFLPSCSLAGVWTRAVFQRTTPRQRGYRLIVTLTTSAPPGRRERRLALPSSSSGRGGEAGQKNNKAFR